MLEYWLDVLILDLSMLLGEFGLIVISKIFESFFEIKILIFMMFDDEEYLFYMLKSGVKGYILKNLFDE